MPFFQYSNEFRTPLTLMLGPLEDTLADVGRALSPEQRGRVELAHRNKYVATAEWGCTPSHVARYSMSFKWCKSDGASTVSAAWIICLVIRVALCTSQACAPPPTPTPPVASSLLNLRVPRAQTG